MYCPKCGNNVDDQADFCPACGTKLHQNYQTAPGSFRAPIPNRNIAVAVILSFVTCGIYLLYWLYCIVNELNLASGEKDDTSGGLVVLLSIVTCDIYLLYWMYKAGGKVNRIRYYNGEMQDSSNGILYLLLSFFGLSVVSLALIQNELNKVADL